MRAGAPGRWPPSALCSLTEQMHLHGYVQRKFADATCKHRVHDRDDFAREHDRRPSAANTPKPAAPAGLIARGCWVAGALRALIAAERPEFAPHDRPVLGPDQHESGAARRL